MTENVIETWAREEYRRGVSPEAAARQLCRSLGCAGSAPTLKRMLEDLLANGNRRGHDRAMILRDFADAAPDDVSRARMASFRRLNPPEPEVH